MGPLRSAILLAAAALVPAVLSAQPTAKTWIGADGADFATGTNWSPAGAPADSTGTNYVVFNRTTTTNLASLSASRSIAGIDFTSTTSGGNLSHSGSNIVLTLGSRGLLTTAADTATVDVALALSVNTTFTDNGNTLWINRGVNLGANTLTLGGTGTYFYSRLLGPISGTGGITINHAGTYGWVFSDNNTYTGNTTLTAGTVISGDNGFGTGTLIFNGGRLGANSGVSYNNAVTIANGANFTPGTGPITLNGAVTMTGAQGFNISNTGSVVLNGALGQTGTGDLSKSGVGALVLNGTSSYTGMTYINMGTLALGPSASLSTGNLVLTRGGVLSTSGTFARATGTGDNQFMFGTGGGGFAAYGGALTIASPSLTNNPEWTSFTTDYLYLNSTVANNVVTWTHSLQMSVLSDYHISVANNTTTSADKAVFSGALSGSGRLNIEGAGDLELSGANTYTGGTTAQNGILRLANTAALGTGAVTLQSTSLVLATDTAFNLANSFSSTGGSLPITSDRLTAGAGLMHRLGNLSSASTITIVKGANVTSGTAGIGFDAVTGGSFTVGAGAGLELGSYSSTVNTTFNGAGDTTILGTFTTGTGTLTKSGTGALTLLGSSTRTGGTTFSAGSLILGTDTALGTGAVTVSGSPTLSGTAGVRTIAVPFNLNSGLTLGGTSDLALTGTITNTNTNTLAVTNTGTTTLSGAVNLSNSATNRLLTISNDGTVVLSGAIANGSTSPASALTKTGSGLLTLSGANTFGGNLTVNAGTLSLTGSIASSFAIVANGATLTGGGSLHSLNLNGIYAPGASVAQVQLDNLTMSSTALLRMEIAGATPGTGYDQLHLTGTFTAAGTLDVLFTGGFNPSGTQSFRLIDAATLAGSFSQFNLPNLGTEWSWDTSALLTTGHLTVNFTPVPEPSTYALLATGLGLAFIARRRRSASRS